MRRRYEASESLLDIATDYAVTEATVSAAIRRNGGVIRHRNSGIRRGKQVVKEHGAEMRRRYETGEFLADIASAYDISLTTVASAIRKNGGVIRKRGFGSAPEKFTGANNPAWRGGRYVRNGYAHLKIPADHPMAAMRTIGGYILEHRLVMAEMIKRPLLPTETVHHIDGDGLNNDPSNLQLRLGRHGNGSHWRCGDCGSQNIHAAQI